MNDDTMTIDLQKIFLSAGSHGSREDGMCAMELAAMLAGESHSDTPACVCPKITVYVHGLNDGWEDRSRQRLTAYAKDMIGTIGDDELTDARHYAILDGAIREIAPFWLAAAGLDREAKRLRDLAPISEANAYQGLFVLRAAVRASEEAREKAVGKADSVILQAVSWADSGLMSAMTMRAVGFWVEPTFVSSDRDDLAASVDDLTGRVASHCATIVGITAGLRETEDPRNINLVQTTETVFTTKAIAQQLQLDLLVRLCAMVRPEAACPAPG